MTERLSTPTSVLKMDIERDHILDTAEPLVNNTLLDSNVLSGDDSLHKGESSEDVEIPHVEELSGVEEIPRLDESQSSSHLVALPTELIQHIAYLLPTDRDLANFTSTCSSISFQILPAHSSVWRSRFHALYDVSPNRSSLELKREYQIRSIVLRNPISFQDGETEKQTLWLETMKTLILEALEIPYKNGQWFSKNVETIRRLLCHTRFLDRPVVGSDGVTIPSDLFCINQLLLTSLALHPKMSIGCLRTDYDLDIIYSFHGQRAEFIQNGKVNLQILMHIRNFWHRHVLNHDENTFFYLFINLKEDRLPGLLKSLELKDLPLSPYWLGFTSCLHPLPDGLEEDEEERQTCADLEDHVEWVPLWAMSIHIDRDPANWPPVFQQVLPFMDGPENRVYFKGTRGEKCATAKVEERYPLRGFVEPFRHPQGEIPGWKRVCWAVYYPKSRELPLVPHDAVDQEIDSWFPQEVWPPTGIEDDFYELYFFEGVVLPGGRVMLGYWQDALWQEGDGPFIFWDTERAFADEMIPKSS
ncbi:hypothetical protein ASPZODRAFT_163714 [Penicilliopsis zonata CBS 506.65]|uniref:F-box domain-containing protein n=1 Tax=Penicilliopsis zonata CBS 506.65 TaxID=1073090 RepID=A0A1L9SR72_9EURO|nr:hypothetical protein ASPZODRAFT_163714 [Penicilliopsis zonata CBS 506.65]OJJ49623.1 hypothetical protein ASPZODRAFT_163714 [Penicilliopsis zonata CBS 506.65]